MAKLTTNWQSLASWTYTFQGYGNSVTFYLDARYTTQSISNNTSNIETRLRSVLSGGSAYGNGYNYTCSYAPTVSGSGQWNFETETITSGSGTVTHENDGTKSLSLSASVSNTAWGFSHTLSATAELPQIARASAVSCTSPYIGDVATITIDRKSSSFTHTVTYSIGSLSGTIATKSNSVALSLNTNSIKSQIYALIPNSKSTSGTIYCETYSGNTKIGDTKSATFNLYAKEVDCKPDVSGTVIDTNQNTINLTGNNSIIVKNASKPKVTVSATRKYSSSISSYSINLNDGQTSNSQEHTFNTINSNSITVGATDSRGYSNTSTIDLTNRVINYIKLSFNTINLQRTEGTSNEIILNADGAFYNGSFSDNVTNSISCYYVYRESGTDTWINGGTITPTIINNSFRFNNLSLGNIYDYEKEYQFKIIAEDLLITIGNESKDIQTVTKGVAVVEIGDELVNVNGKFKINNMPFDIKDSALYNVDANDFKESGLYYFGPDCENIPAPWSKVIVNGGHDVSQLGVYVDSNEPQAYIRGYDGTNWSNWKLLNSVYEEGSNSNGNYIKYADGTMICWHIIVGETFACTQSGGSGRYYYVDANNSYENAKRWVFPSQFKQNTTPTVNVNVSSRAYTMPCVGSATNEWATANCVLPYAVSNVTFTWHFTAIGKWK